jgi:two-component sensor histidine kinase
MDLIPGDSICVIDADGMIIWSNQVFIENFSHRSPVIGTSFSQLFAGIEDPCRPGVIFEDKDKLGRKRFFKAECKPMIGHKGIKVSDVIVLKNITLMKTVAEISRFSTQTKTPKEFFERALWLIKDTYAYMGIAGFVARGNVLEVVSSKGWTEKLKSMIGVQPITPDSIGMAGRSAFHKKQMVTTIEDYAYLPAAKSAIERIGGEFIVTTPLIDQGIVTGVLTVIHSSPLSEDDLETLRTICGQIAISLNVRLQSESLIASLDDAELYVDLISHRLLDNGFILMKSLENALTSKPEESRSLIREAMRLAKKSDLSIEDISKKDAEKISIDSLITIAISEAEDYAKSTGKKVNFKYNPLKEITIMVSPLLKYAVYNILNNSIKHSTLMSVDIEIKAIKDRSGTYRLEISDNGTGIPDEMKSEVFRKQKAILDKKGAGIGLYIVKKLVNREGGRVWIEDRIPGNSARGARVVMTFPQAPTKP